MQARLVLFVFVSIAFIMIPGASSLLDGYLLRLFGGRARIIGFASAFLVIGFLAMLNASREVETDLANYVEIYTQSVGHSLISVLQWEGGSIRNTEPLYYFIQYLVANLSNGNIFLLVVVVTCAIYIPVLTGVEVLAKRIQLSGQGTTATLFFALLAGLTFTQTLHLIRQYIAGSLAFIGLVMSVDRRAKLGFLICFFATLCHNSIVFLVAAGVLSYIMPCESRGAVFRNAFVLFILGLIVGVYFDNTVATDFLDWAYLIQLQDDGDISWYVFAFDATMLACFVCAIFYGTNHDPNRLRTFGLVFAIWLFLLGFLIAVASVKIWFLRFYLYLEWFRIFGMFGLLSVIESRLHFTKSSSFILFVAIVILAARIHVSPFDYGGGLLDQLVQPIAVWTHQIDRVN